MSAGLEAGKMAAMRRAVRDRSNVAGRRRPPIPDDLRGHKVATFQRVGLAVEERVTTHLTQGD